MKRVSVAEFTKNPDVNVYEIEDEYGKVFKKNKEVKDVMNKMFPGSVKAVYSYDERRTDHLTVGNRGVNIDCNTFYIINSKGKLLVMWGSEWGSVEMCK